METNGDSTGLSAAEIKDLLEFIDASGWDEAHITIGDSTISVSKGGGSALLPPRTETAASEAQSARPAPAEAPAAPSNAAATAPAAAPNGHSITSPSVGVFWRSPEPGAPPFVQIGDRVEIGMNLCIVEVMKLMNYVAADVTGHVRAIHIENGHPVEHGTVLFSIEPEQG